jgi:hypothetical protein
MFRINFCLGNSKKNDLLDFFEMIFCTFEKDLDHQYNLERYKYALVIREFLEEQPGNN